MVIQLPSCSDAMWANPEHQFLAYFSMQLGRLKVSLYLHTSVRKNKLKKNITTVKQKKNKKRRQLVVRLFTLYSHRSSGLIFESGLCKGVTPLRLVGMAI